MHDGEYGPDEQTKTKNIMRLISSDALDRFFGHISHKAREFKEGLEQHAIGDFVYYDCDEVAENLKPKAKKCFREFIERNPLQVNEYNQ